MWRRRARLGGLLAVATLAIGAPSARAQVATRTPIPTRTPIATRTPAPTRTAIVPDATRTPIPAWTPTPTFTPISCLPERSDPIPCTGARKLRLRWEAKAPFNLAVFLSASDCAPPPRCAEAARNTLVTVPPVSLVFTDAVNGSLEATIASGGANVDGCPGADTYGGFFGRLRLVYGFAGQATLVGKLKLQQREPVRPSWSGPMRFSVRDGCGYFLEGTATNCVTRESATRTEIRCDAAG